MSDTTTTTDGTGGLYWDGAEPRVWVLDRYPLRAELDWFGRKMLFDATGDRWDRSALVEGPPGLWTGTVRHTG